VQDADHEHAAMLTLGQAIDRRFAQEDPWAREALAVLGQTGPDDEVHDVAKGWLRIGGDSGTLVDALFVLTASRIGFAQTSQDGLPPQWIPLRSIVALDAIEGLPYPLVTVEVQLSGDVAILVGWPDAFCSIVVDVLTEDLARANDQSQAPPEPESMPEDFADPASTASAADPATLDDLDPSPWQEQDVTEPAPGDWAASAQVSSDEPVIEDEAPLSTPFSSPPVVEPPTPSAPVPPAGLFGVIGDTGSFDPAFDELTHDEPTFDESQADEPTAALDESSDESPAGEAPLSSFHSATSALFAASDPEVEERADAFFSDEHPEAGEEIAAFAEEPPPFAAPAPSGGMTPPAFASRMIQWPEPFRSVVYMGENPNHPRRRKGVTLAFSPAGVTAVSSGFSAWKVHLGWDDVSDLEFQGADEVKFTYDHRIDVNATAAIVGLNDGTAMVFEIKGRRPATLRSSMAPIVNAVKSHRASIHGTDSFQF
jgi:hypothetical protein